MTAKPTILVTNDDGINAPGIKALVEVARAHGNVVVVAPDSPQSAKGHAITITGPIRVKKVAVFEGIDSYECSGTPADCVKLAKSVILKNESIALCVSGVNHGSNASINIIYSGTLSAAMEASIEGIPSIGFSLLDYSFEADFTAAKHYAGLLIEYVLTHGMPHSHLWNVNIPKLPLAEIKGVRACKQAEARWVEDFLEAKDPHNQPYYWLTGKFVVDKEEDSSDVWALEHGYVAVVPSSHDLTDYTALEQLEQRTPFVR